VRGGEGEGKGGPLPSPATSGALPPLCRGVVLLTRPRAQQQHPASPRLLTPIRGQPIDDFGRWLGTYVRVRVLLVWGTRGGGCARICLRFVGAWPRLMGVRSWAGLWPGLRISAFWLHTWTQHLSNWERNGGRFQGGGVGRCQGGSDPVEEALHKRALWGGCGLGFVFLRFVGG
jgi:hypothetical protein